MLQLTLDIGSIIREEMKNVLSEDFDHLKSELQAMRAEIANNTTAIPSEIDKMRANIQEVDGGLSTWSDAMQNTVMQNTVTEFKNQVKELKEKCEDLEGRMRKANIAGVAGKLGSSFTTAVSKLLKEVLQMDRDLHVDHIVVRHQGDREEDQ